MLLPLAQHLDAAGPWGHKDQQQERNGGDDHVNQQHTYRVQDTFMLLDSWDKALWSRQISTDITWRSCHHDMKAVILVSSRFFALFFMFRRNVWEAWKHSVTSVYVDMHVYTSDLSQMIRDFPSASPPSRPPGVSPCSFTRWLSALWIIIKFQQ